ncbi:hypothetical protein CR194_16465 [Salipaludibacillus keqinensis]|uniref:DUF3939 domain-containing protein n=1 Tax=Salipaludibacillus keqinensis TaxID=2045207 RepID=A0A323TAM8_9BACI|nr:DUF3939 domain-containing protein [Salipaludibacillus keqinensis]PYZ92421.1 hypothetical protein CR194_16465 [Salipaludibacillus keqinensis]
MFFRRKRKDQQNQAKKEVKEITVSIDDVRSAVNKFALKLDKGISLRSIVSDNHEIDFELLHSYLGGKPDRPFYMSKETFEIFEDPEYPKHIDFCQIACDQYLLETGEEPCIPGDRSKKISYFKLQNYLIQKPPFDLYLDSNDRMVTHRKPTDQERKE